MNINNSIKIIAGILVLISVTLAHFINNYWFLLSVFVAVNLIQSSFTKWCLMETILKRIGVKEGGDSCAI